VLSSASDREPPQVT